MGRLTRDPDVRYTQGAEAKAVAKYTLAIDRRYARRDDPNAQTADFINCTAFGKAAEFAEKYLHKGIKIAVIGHIQTGSYTNKDGQKVYTTEVVIEEQEFAESKGSGGAGQAAGQQDGTGAPAGQQVADDGFMQIPDGLEDELPFA